MTGVHDALRALALRSTRYFAKTELPATVAIERLSAKDNPRFVVVAGAILLVASKEDQFLVALTQLAASGVGEQKVKPTPLSAARCQSFFSDGLTAGAGPSQPTSPRPADQREPPSYNLPRGLLPRAYGEVQPSGEDGGQAFITADDGPSQEVYREVSDAGAQAVAEAARKSRQKRQQSRKATPISTAQKPPALLPSPLPAQLGPSPLPSQLQPSPVRRQLRLSPLPGQPQPSSPLLRRAPSSQGAPGGTSAAFLTHTTPSPHAPHAGPTPPAVRSPLLVRGFLPPPKRPRTDARASTTAKRQRSGGSAEEHRSSTLAAVLVSGQVEIPGGMSHQRKRDCLSMRGWSVAFLWTLLCHLNSCYP